MVLDPRIHFQANTPFQLQSGIQQINARDQQMAAAKEEQARKQQLRDFFAQQGAGVFQGDPNALAALAALDPGLAQRAQAQQADLEFARSRMGLAQQQADLAQKRFGLQERTAEADIARAARAEQRQAQAFDLQLRQAEIEQSQRDAERSLAMLQTADTPEEWDAMARQYAPQMVGKFAQRDALVAAQIGLLKAISLTTPEKAPNGFRWNGNELEAIPGGPHDPEVIRNAAEARQVDEFERVYGPDGSVVFERGTGTDTGGQKKLSERQSQLELFGRQMETIQPALERLEGQFDPTNVADAALSSMVFGNALRSEEKQLYEALANAWAEGVLRIQTGAAATQPEIERVVQTYFPRFGDTAQTVQLKRKLRDNFFNSVTAAKGFEVSREPVSTTDAQQSPAPPAETESMGQRALQAARTAAPDWTSLSADEKKAAIRREIDRMMGGTP